MKKIYTVCLLACILATQLANAQTTPFMAVWSFEGTSSGSSSTPLVTASAVTYHDVNLSVTPYSAGHAGQGANVQHWSTTGCNNSEYVEFSVQPSGSATITLTSLSFSFARTPTGPQQLMVRSSTDGFSSDIYSQGVTESYQVATISLSGSGFTNQAGPITFHIYACNATHTGGLLKFDELSINAAALPVTLLSFIAKPEGDRVQLAWATTSERDADRFVVERSLNLSEYVTVGEIAAKGNADERQYYGLTDLNPQPGVNYYRLRQIDVNGMLHSVKPISAIIEAEKPVVTVYPNPADPHRIHVRLWNTGDAKIRLLTPMGQPVGGQLEQHTGGADLLFNQPLPMGLYWLEVQINEQKRVLNVLVR